MGNAGAILGISCHYHDAAAALMVDGRIVAAVEEEKLSRVKHDASFPARAAAFCLGRAGLKGGDLACVAFYERPFARLDHWFRQTIDGWPRTFPWFASGAAEWGRQRLWFRAVLEEKLGFSGKVLTFPHHLSHAAAAFFPSGFASAAVLTVDGVGEEDTTCWGTASLAGGVSLKERLPFPHSLGLFYSTVTAYLGFEPNDGEYKVMGLAPYGRPSYLEALGKTLRGLGDGAFELDPSYFGFQYGRKMWSGKLEGLLGFPPRKKGGELTQAHKDLAASAQKLAEGLLLAAARHVRDRTGEKNLALGGGVALNCVANSRLLAESGFEKVFVFPSPGDGGSAVGACHLAHREIFPGVPTEPLSTAALGPSFADVDVLAAAKARGGVLLGPELAADDLAKRTAELVWGRDATVGWCRGPAEFGPRALGRRSILGDPRKAENWRRINLKIKFRESFRPFAPAVTREARAAHFDPGFESPYMLFTQRTRDPGALPAVTHVDGSSRVQTVSREENPDFHAFLSSGPSPVAINTSLNRAGEPIACSPGDAMDVLLGTGLDALVVGNRIATKKHA